VPGPAERIWDAHDKLDLAYAWQANEQTAAQSAALDGGGT
jgi:hypothetical protein